MLRLLLDDGDIGNEDRCIRVNSEIRIRLRQDNSFLSATTATPCKRWWRWWRWRHPTKSLVSKLKVTWRWREWLQGRSTRHIETAVTRGGRGTISNAQETNKNARLIFMMCCLREKKTERNLTINLMCAWGPSTRNVKRSWGRTVMDE